MIVDRGLLNANAIVMVPVKKNPSVTWSKRRPAVAIPLAKHCSLTAGSALQSPHFRPIYTSKTSKLLHWFEQNSANGIRITLMCVVITRLLLIGYLKWTDVVIVDLMMQIFKIEFPHPQINKRWKIWRTKLSLFEWPPKNRGEKKSL